MWDQDYTYREWENVRSPDQDIFNKQAFDYQSVVLNGLKISGEKTNIFSKYKKN